MCRSSIFEMKKTGLVCSTARQCAAAILVTPCLTTGFAGLGISLSFRHPLGCCHLLFTPLIFPGSVFVHEGILLDACELVCLGVTRQKQSLTMHNLWVCWSLPTWNLVCFDGACDLCCRSPH